MKLIDTHCHLTHGRLRQQADEALQRAREAGVIAVICAAADMPETKNALSLAHRHDDVFCTAGIHPHEAKNAPHGYIEQLRQAAHDMSNVAIGEIGLDYHYDFSPRPDQQRIFAEQLELAKQLGKPIVIHTREAFDDTMAIIRNSGVDGGRIVFHSCTDGPAAVQQALDIGATISFSGIATFKSATDVQQSVAITPDDRIMIETDSPYLSPEPVRKMKTNEPANVAHVATHLAAIRKTAAEKFAELTTANAVRFFVLNFQPRILPY